MGGDRATDQCRCAYVRFHSHVDELQLHVAAVDMGAVFPLDPGDGDLPLSARRHLRLCLLLLGVHYGDSMDLLSPFLWSFGVLRASAATVSLVHAGDCAAFLMEILDSFLQLRQR